MFQRAYDEPLTRRHENSQPQQMPFSGKIRFLMDQRPFRLLLTLEGVWISEQALGARVPLSRLEHVGLCEEDVNALFSEGNICQLQLEHDDAQYSCANVCAHVFRKQWTHGAIDIAFRFESTDSDLLMLLQDMSSAAVR